MKRLLLLLGCVAAFSSCLKNDKFERDMTSTGYIIYSSAAKQTLVALDPFNVAFRLNILIAEGDGDFNAAPGEIRQRMFSTGTVISYDETRANYKLVFNSGSISGDYPRKGTITISTNGYGSLAEAGARWDIYLSDSYAMFSDSKAIYTSSSTYSVTNSGDNTWQVSIQQLVSVLPDAGIVEGSDGSEIKFESDWTASYTIKQEKGTQKLTDVRNSIFTISTSVLNGKTMYLPADQLNVSTPKPVQFNPACSASAPVGNGLMTISLANDDEMMSNYTTAEVMGGDQLNTCFPKIKISYGGYTTEY